MSDTAVVPTSAPPDVKPPPKESAWRLNLGRLVLVLVLLGAWQLAAVLGKNGDLIGQPSTFLTTFVKGIGDRSLLSAAWVTTEETLVGLLAGLVGGILLAFVVNLVPRLGSALQPYLIALYSLPKLAIAPLMILWVGIGFESVVTFVFLVSFFFIFFSVDEGLRNPPGAVVSQMHIMGSSRFTILTKVLLPSTTEWIFTGLKIAVPYALISAVGAELVSSSGSGVGFVILNALQFDELNDVFAALILIVALGVVLNLVTEVLRRRVLRWK